MRRAVIVLMGTMLMAPCVLADEPVSLACTDAGCEDRILVKVQADFVRSLRPAVDPSNNQIIGLIEQPSNQLTISVGIDNLTDKLLRLEHNPVAQVRISQPMSAAEEAGVLAQTVSPIEQYAIESVVIPLEIPAHSRVTLDARAIQLTGLPREGGNLIVQATVMRDATHVLGSALERIPLPQAPADTPSPAPAETLSPSPPSPSLTLTLEPLPATISATTTTITLRGQVTGIVGGLVQARLQAVGQPEEDITSSVTVTGDAATFAKIVPLAIGSNLLTVRLRDGQGREATAQVTISRAAPPLALVLEPLPSTVSATTTTITLRGQATGITGGLTQATLQIGDQPEQDLSAPSLSGETATIEASVPLAVGPNLLTVRLRDGQGREATAQVTITRPAPPLAVALVRPRSTVFATTTTITLYGQATGITGGLVRARIQVGDQPEQDLPAPSLSGETATFQASVPLAVGPNLITVRLRDGQGRDATAQVTTTRPAPPALMIEAPMLYDQETILQAVRIQGQITGILDRLQRLTLTVNGVPVAFDTGSPAPSVPTPLGTTRVNFLKSNLSFVTPRITDRLVVRVEAVDGRGEPGVFKEVTIRRRLPALTVEALFWVRMNATTCRVGGSVTGVIGGLKRLEVRKDGILVSPSPFVTIQPSVPNTVESPVSFAIHLPKQRGQELTFVITATDSGGPEGSERQQSRTVTVPSNL